VTSRSIAGDSIVGLNTIVPASDLTGQVGSTSLRFANFYLVQGFFGASANTGYVRLPWGSAPNTGSANGGGVGVDTNNYALEVNTGDGVFLASLAQKFTVVVPDSGVLSRDTIHVYHFDSTFFPSYVRALKMRIWSKVAQTDSIQVYRWSQPTTAGTETYMTTLILSSSANAVVTSFTSSDVGQGEYVVLIHYAVTPGTGETIEFYGRANEG